MSALRLRSISARTFVGGALVAGLLALALLSLLARSAGATETRFGSSGEGAGQFIDVEGLAIDQASGDVYTADSLDGRVDELQSSGTFVRAWGWGVLDGEPKSESCTGPCFTGVLGAGVGEFFYPRGLAVDNDSLSPSDGDVYVAETGNERVQKFSATGAFLLMLGGEVNETKDHAVGASEAERNICTVASGDVCGAATVGTGAGQFSALESVAVGSTGTVYLGDENRVQEFDAEGEYLAQIPLVGASFIEALVVDDSGDLYVKSRALSGIEKYSPAGVLLETLDASGEPTAVALDATGNVFIEDRSNGFHILKYSAAGQELASFGDGEGGTGNGIAVDEASGEVYAGRGSTVWTLTQPEPGPLLKPNSEQVGEVQPTSATLAASIDPEGAATTYHFEYGTSTGYGSSTAESGPIGSDFTEIAASASLSGLTPAAEYHYRVVAHSAAGTTFGPDRTFTTLPPVSIDIESTAAVAGTSATLQAQIDPLGVASTYRFEYGTSAAYGASTPVPDGELGAVSEDVAVSSHLQGLQPNTVYHFRVVASNARGTVDGPDKTFATQSAGGELALPDGRQWELVSPPVKEGGGIGPIGESVIQAAANGDAISYTATAPTEAEPAGNLIEAQVFSTRDASGGWSSRDINTPHQEAAGEKLGDGGEYRFFSEDLSLGLVEPLGNGKPPLSAKAGELTVYIRDDAPLTPAGDEQALYGAAAGEALAGAGAAGYLPLVTAANAVAGAQFGGGLEFQGATADLTHVVLRSHAPLTANPVEGGLYEWSAGQLALVSVLPGPGETAMSGSLGTTGSHSAINAISADGSRIVWSAEAHLYLRDTRAHATVQLDAAQGAPEPGPGGEGAIFQLASSDGSKVFFTDTHRLTATSTAGGQDSPSADLYECEVLEVAGEPTCRLSDLTIDANAGEGAGVLGALPGASEDSSYVYLVATGVLAPGASPGEANLYVLHDSGGQWTTRLVATLSGEDGPDWASEPTQRSARVSPSGRFLAFMSNRSLTGYDNRDANSGVRDEEVYLYDALTGQLVCASCNPTGARPVGVVSERGIEIPELLIDHFGTWRNKTLAADVPGWTGMSDASSRHQSRYLSDSGRLFFNGVDALVPQATNGAADVYEYEPPGVGGCTSSSSTFSQVSGGCLGLISAASSGDDSAFLDASENGDDVFFLTTAHLASQDLDNAYDVYDAHVCSAGALCPAVTASSPPCTTADSCRAAPSPQPALFGAPASATFSGSGNAAPASKPVVNKSKQATAKKHKSKQAKKRKAKRRRKARPKAKGKRASRVRRSMGGQGKGSGKHTPSSRSGR